MKKLPKEIPLLKGIELNGHNWRLVCTESKNGKTFDELKCDELNKRIVLERSKLIRKLKKYGYLCDG